MSVATARRGRVCGAGGTIRRAVRRVCATPMPCGRRPSMAALTRSGARKASEIVMLTLRALQPSRAAIALDGRIRDRH